LEASKIIVRKISKEDSPQVAALIRTVMPEFGASGPGFAIHDPEVDDMFKAYSEPRHAYFVVEQGSKILGGGGIAPLLGEEQLICELRKMYFMPELRSLGFGQKVMDQCLAAGRAFKFEKCYLETLKTMEAAKILYRKNDFLPLASGMGNTGHFSCDAWYLKNL
jgi:putative acetyltransferase